MNEKKGVPLPCEIVRDLVPLYHDGVVSAETRSAVGEHLMECAGCRAEYEAMEKPLAEQTGESGGTLDRFRALMRRQRKRKIIAIVLAAVLAACAAVGGVAALGEWYIVPVQADELELKDVCIVETPAGRRAFVLWSCAHSGSTSARYRFTEEAGGGRAEIEIRHPALEWVSIRGSERFDYWFVPLEGDLGAVSFNGETVWTARSDGVREDTGYARAVWELDQALRKAGGMAAHDFAEDYVYLLYPDGHEEYWSYDGGLLDGPTAE